MSAAQFFPEQPLLCVDEAQSQVEALSRVNRSMVSMTAQERIAWALDTLPGNHVLTSSFGIQSAVMLHLMVSVRSDIPVVLIDTGYLFEATYQFIDKLTEALNLNLHVVQPSVSAAWQEARHGKRWLNGAAGIRAYNQDAKVAPLHRALSRLEAGTWFAGLRRIQSDSRQSRKIVEMADTRWKVHPIADWSDRDVHQYLTGHGLPYHPLRDQGYLSVGDTHTTRALSEISSADEARFFGHMRECGLHTPVGDSAT